MADKKITLVLEAKNAMNRGLQGAANSVKGFSERMKGGFDLFAKPILVAGAGLMAFKKGLEWAETALNSLGRASREAKTDILKESFDNLTASVAKMQTQYAKSEATFASNNKIFDAQKKSVRELEEATTALEKAKRLSTASTEEERNAIEQEYEAKKIAGDSAKAQQDILDEVARKRTEASMKEQQAIALEVKAREMGKKSVEALARSAQMADQENRATSGVGGFAGMFSGYSEKEIESIRKAKSESDALAKSAKAEQEKLLGEVAKLRLDSVENIRTASEQEKEVEAEKMKEQAANLDAQRKLEEERVKLAEETAKKITDLKKEEVDAKANIEENARDEHRKAWDKQLRENEEIAKKTVAQFIEDAKGKKGEEKGLADEDKRGKMLSAMEARGTKLSKRDKEWLDAFKDIRKAGDKVGVAKKNIEEMELKKVLKKQNELDANLTRVMGEIVKLQQMN